MRQQMATDVRVADEVWIVTALLHIEHPEREDFTVKEIEERARRESISGELRKGVYPHASLHCVANVPPNPGRYRMLVATARTRRRLFRPGDEYDLAREGGKTVPAREETPARYRYLLDWYQRTEGGRLPEKRDQAGADEREHDGHGDAGDALLALRALGKEIWRDEDADAYVRRLRESWE